MMSACFKDAAAPLLMENAIQIALNYLHRSGEMDDYVETCDFLVDNIATMIRRGQHNKLVLANRAIASFQRYRASRTIEQSKASG
jgi:hypothetical protein